jgi:hypothetical protein
MSRSSYFQRIARADRNVPTLRPPPAVFRRWEMTQTTGARQQPPPVDKSPLAAEPIRKLSPKPAASPGLRTAIQVPGTELSAPDRLDEGLQQPHSDGPTEKDIGHTAKTSVRTGPVEAEMQPGRDSAEREARAKPGATREPVNAPRNLNSKARSHVSVDANLSLNPSTRSELPANPQTFDSPAREALNSSTNATMATSASEAPDTRKSAEAPRLLQTHYRSHERRESAPAPPLTRLPAAEKSQPTVKIGTIDVQITPPVAMPQPSLTRLSTRKPATALSRGFTSSFGLRQG